MSTANDALGTLLDPDGEPYINTATGTRIRIGIDQIENETYAQPPGDHAVILIDDPETTANEQGWVVDAQGNRIGVQGDDGDTVPLVLSPGGYTIATEPGDISGGGDDTSDDSDSEDEGPGPSTGTVGTPNQYGVEDAIETVGEGESTMSIAGITIPGLYELTQSGEGRKSQYLRETQRNGANQREQGTEYPWEENADDSDDDSEEAGGGGGGGDDLVPPLVLDIRAYVASSVYEELDALRESPATSETFSVELGEISLDNCELVELTRTLSGERPNLYDARIKVREYREYEVIDNTVQATGGDGTNSSGDARSPSGEFATPVREWTDANNDGLDDETGEPLPEVRTTNSLNASLGSGEALENVLVTSGNATIRTNGDGWAIRNVGVEGPIRRSGSAWFNVKGSGIIENVYIRGPSPRTHDGSLSPGIFVHPDCTGPVLIRFAHVRHFTDNAIYASAVGNGPSHSNPGNGAQIGIESCYAEANSTSDFRLGTDGSYVRDSVGVNNLHRTMWGYYEHTRAINCDFTERIVTGGSAHPKMASAQVTIENTRVGGSLGGGVNGTSAGAPNTTPPDRVPMSAEEAANGRFYSEPPSGSL